MPAVNAITVPFTTREWNLVKNTFRKNGQDLKIATDILDMWKARQGNETYLVFQITDHLLTLDRLDDMTDRRDSLQVKTLVNNYCTVLIRVINYINELCQAEMAGATIAAAVKTVGIPEWVVELRHDASHKLMPKMCMLRRATCFIRGWLWTRYWSKSVQDAMQWATPKVVIDGQVLKTQEEKISSYCCSLILDYFDWRNEDASKIVPPEKIRNYKKLLDALAMDSRTLISAFISDALVILDESRLDDMQFIPVPEKKIFRISKLHQLFWGPLLTLIYNEHHLLSLIMETVAVISDDEKTEITKKQLAGWIDCFIEMISQGKLDYVTADDRSNWRVLFKQMLNNSEYFTEQTVVQVMKNAGIFSDKKVEQVEKLMKIGSQVGPLLGKRFSDGLRKMADSKENIIPAKIVDVNEGQEWALSDVDFTTTPLGLMPYQTCDSLYLIIH
uniref:LAS1-like protein n=1 Tax=Panagrolaimus sp. JU765 TaxID=591449 RepID=A0AC34QPD1_9BILA